MNENKLAEVERLIKLKKIKDAELKLSQLGSEYFKNSEYLYLRGKIFFINKLYYIALDTLLIATEFENKNKVYDLIAKIYTALGNRVMSKKVSNPDLRFETINSLKKELTGISQKD